MFVDRELTAVRILFAAHHSTRVAGTETYVHGAMRALAEQGHAVALLAERPPIAGRATVHDSRWCAGEMGEVAALAEARGWRPDVVYVHGLQSISLERAAIALAPAVLFAHNYSGLCISGSRTWQSSDAPCTRAFGPACLVHYLPHRCGGYSPRTMLRLYALQRERRKLHASYRAIVVGSLHMAAMIAPTGMKHRVHVVPLPVDAPVSTLPRQLQNPTTLAYIGRLERLKGVQLLVDAAADAAARMRRSVELHVAGDGPMRASIERRRQELDRGGISVVMHGWISPSERDALLATTDALLVPSLWPEPFGLTGLEAARFGVPSVAFPSGAIPEWLHDGVNGILASQRTAAGLGIAIARCVGEPGVYRQLSAGAIDSARAVSPAAHAIALERVLLGATA